jgi:hypothetical protein
VKDLDQGLNDCGVADPLLNGAWLVQRPLLRGIIRVEGCMARFKERVKAFYFEVMLSPYRCPKCEGSLSMTGISQCSCACGQAFDPTLEFQRSPCCGAKLVRKTYHYACSRCHVVVPSHFLFDERVFDKEYFREIMQEHRRRSREEREEMKKSLGESRSGTLLLTEEPHLESLDGFVQDLDAFIQSEDYDSHDPGFEAKSTFSMDRYRSHILSCLAVESVRFSEIAPVDEDIRRDRAWRFITLVFMQNERVIDLAQEGDDIWVQRLRNEAHA